MDAATLWSRLSPDDRGLVVAVVQHDETDQVLMVGYMSEASLAATLEHGRVTFWSRSRGELWEKGATSGHTLHLRELRYDCDADALLVRAHPIGPTCHTGKPSCFFRRVVEDHSGPVEDEGPAAPSDRTFAAVFGVIEERKAGRGITSATKKSYVRSLLDKGIGKISEKIREEAGELCDALDHESDERVANETADLFFHAMVGLASRGMQLARVAEVFAARFGVSGIDEKAARKS